MARGISAYFGINLKNNFERPYFSTSVEEFWRRWHITLSTWFRDYLFYPLQRTACFKNLGKKLKNKGYKKAAKAIPAILALLVVWLTTGLWHGANLTYVAWGLYYGMFMVFGVIWNTYRKKGTKKEPSGIKGNILTVLKIAKTFFIVCVGYILFNSATLSDAFGMLANMFDLTRLIVPSEIFYAGVRFYKEVGAALYFTITVVCTLILIAYDLLEEREISVSGWLQKQNKVVKYCLSAITVLILLFLMGRSSGDFTYMQF